MRHVLPIDMLMPRVTLPLCFLPPPACTLSFYADADVFIFSLRDDMRQRCHRYLPNAGGAIIVCHFATLILLLRRRRYLRRRHYAAIRAGLILLRRMPMALPRLRATFVTR